MKENDEPTVGLVAPAGVTGEKHASKGVIIGMVVLAVVAVAGIAFGIIELMQVFKKNDQIADLSQQVTNCMNTENIGTAEKIEVTCPDGTITEVVSSEINNALAQTIVDPYLVHFGAFSDIFDYDFDVNAKIKIAFDNLSAAEVASATMSSEWSVTVPYDGLNREYKYLFGSDQEIEKRSYDTPHFGSFSFIEGQGSGLFKVEINGMGGSGATMFSIVKGARYSGSNLVVDVYHDAVSWCETDDKIGNEYCVKAYSAAKSESVYNLIKNFADRVPVYTMTFAEDDGHYILKNVQK
ncbi:hypothetical protein IJI00_01260 [Candidatus Saccharibacteria bacterium]|nr:hypothetical protein [Candidatus Saccharibacteria bacterium]